MKRITKAFSLILGLTLASNAVAYNHEFGKQKPDGGGKPTTQVTRGAGCAPASFRMEFQFNDVFCRLETGGLLFNDRSNGKSTYRIPKGGNVFAINAASLWMGGKDENGQLKLAAVRYRNTGNDFWPGPLTVDPTSVDQSTYNMNHVWLAGDVRPSGEANVDPAVCLQYDQIFTIRKAEVIGFITWWECDNGISEPKDCKDVEKPINDVLDRIYAWPGNGDPTRGQDQFLAPYYDRDKDNVYDPDKGDYPWYDDILNRDDVQCGFDRRITLFGDETHWWIFNDKGDIHSESKGEPIGMEIRAQAFAFATADEINKMTFYNYELINRGTQTLEKTYFAQYVDADLGNAADDYVGCDVTRGLGYILNGDPEDEPSQGNDGYGINPPALGVDFFEGPYQDADLKDNPGPKYNFGTKKIDIPSVAFALANDGIVYSGLGIGYSDSIIDNERYGMRKFMYYTGTAPAAQSDPNVANEYYNYMQGLWKDNSQLVYGGTGYPGSTGSTSIATGYAFPDDSDTLDWGTDGSDPAFAWSEQTNSNPVGDRRFVQSAGPFTLKPGAVNNITVGIVFGRNFDGDLYASVRSVKQADTKAQALFDNCFRILEPPQAPRLEIKEFENELVLLLTNPSSSNNFKEGYIEEDKINISDPGTGEIYDKFYRFEGYEIYQVLNAEASSSDVEDNSKARLVAQCDVKNGVTKLVNFEFDEALGFSIPNEKVKGEDKGVRHSFKMTTDAFTQSKLVNHKTYYYIALAYGYNNYKTYSPNDPDGLDGQRMPYLRSRLAHDGTGIEAVSAVPHSLRQTNKGTVLNSGYGSSPLVTRLDGSGNGGNDLALTQASEDEIVKNGFMNNPTYEGNSAPVAIQVVDPLNVVGGHFELKFRGYTLTTTLTSTAIDTAEWVVYRYDKKGGTIIDSVSSDKTVLSDNEQIIPQWGISVKVFHKKATGSGAPQTKQSDPIAARVTYADSSKRWISFVEDNSSFTPLNWIRAGSYKAPAADCGPVEGAADNPCSYPDETTVDPDLKYAKLLGGGVAPHKLTGWQGEYMPLAYPDSIKFPSANKYSPGSGRGRAGIAYLPSVDIVLTTDKTKWTRCPVIELGRVIALNQNGGRKGKMRNAPSVDKEGLPDNTGTTGMGWFPGYAIDLETGARLQMAFGENSFLGGHNGNDMKWNPTSTVFDGSLYVQGGMHPIYIYGIDINEKQGEGCPRYSETSSWVKDKYDLQTTVGYNDLFTALMWVVNPVVTEGQTLLSNQARISLRVDKEYKNLNATGLNNGRPMYEWNMDGLVAQTGVQDQFASALDEINVVPNPYYAFSGYERNQLDTRVKIVNLPDQCTVTIYNASGKLMRTFKKDNSVTTLDWDMKNAVGIPIVSGVYLIHVEMEDGTERVLKFFGGIRQVDLENL